MRGVTLVSSIALLASCGPVATEAPERQACFDLLTPEARATFSGKLTEQLFAGPPNFESIANGDAEEPALILELAERACADDGMFIEASSPFDRVHLSTDDPQIAKLLNAAVGREVTVSGEGYGAHTGHHHAPLVLDVDDLSIP